MLERNEYVTAIDDFFTYTEMAEEEISESTFGKKRYLHLYEDDEQGDLHVRWLILQQHEVEMFQSVEARASRQAWPTAFYIEIRPMSAEDREQSMAQDINLWQLRSWAHIQQEMKSDMRRQYDKRKKGDE